MDFEDKNANVWKACGFQSSPFFQDEFPPNSNIDSLFVGREDEQRQLITTISSTSSSRQAVAGFPGVGKTTLVEVIKAKAKKAKYCVADELISITPEHSSNVLVGQLIVGIYDAILIHNSKLKDNNTMKKVEPLIKIIRQQNIGIGGGIAGFNFHYAATESLKTPAGGPILPGPDLIQSMLKLALDEGSKGVILHLNNLENLSESDTENAAKLLRSVRDTGLKIHGLHVIIVGPTSAVRAIINRYTQIESVFSPILFLDQLTLSDVHKLLQNRYEALRIDTNKPFENLIDDAIVKYLYNLFNGDLRNMLKSLDYGTQKLLSKDANSLPCTLAEFSPIITELSQKKYEELQENLGELNWNRIVQWADEDSDSMQTQESLSEKWGLKNVSPVMKDFITAGVVETLSSKIDRKIQYSLTGSARLATCKSEISLTEGHLKKPDKASQGAAISP